jgi:hypothetical protein
MGRRGGQTNGAAGCRTDFSDPAVSRSLKGLPHLNEVPRVVPVRQGNGSTRLVVVLGASGPWGWSLGPMEMRAVRRITGAPTGPVTTEN